MDDQYLTIAQEGKGLYVEKRSRFLSFVHHVGSKEDIKVLIDKYRCEFYDARHICYAYSLMKGKEVRANDDGEPSGTAGKPILGQIIKYGLTDTLVVVIRYYGGVNLGTGGLVMAYKTASSDAILHSKIEVRFIEEVITYDFPYEMMEKVMRLIKEMKPKVVSQTYGNMCQVVLTIRRSMAEELRGRLQNLSF